VLDHDTASTRTTAMDMGAMLGIVVALQDHRDRITRLLDGLDAIRVAGPAPAADDPGVGVLLKRFSERLRAGEDRLGWLVAQIERAPVMGTDPDRGRQTWQ
jgi:hypothetical protein